MARAPAAIKTTPEAASAEPKSAETVVEPKADQNVELGTKNFTDFTLEDWKNYIENNKLKTITLGENTTVFLSPDYDGNYIGINTDLGVIRLKDGFNFPLKHAFETRLKEAGIDPVLNGLRKSREKILRNSNTGRFTLTILEGDKNDSAASIHPVEFESDNKTISDILDINKIESQRVVTEKPTQS